MGLIFFIFGIFVMFFLAFLVSPIAIFAPLGRVANGVIRFWGKVSMKIGMINLLVEGVENIPRDKPIVFISNHQSAIDIPAIFAASPVGIRFIAKRELAFLPFFGPLLLMFGFVLVNRGNKRKALKSLDVAANKIAKGTNILLFGEGTRSTNGEMAPFQSGAFVLAIKSGVPIVPVSLSGTIQVNNKLKPLKLNLGKTVKIIFHKPVSTANISLADRYRLKDNVEKIVRDGYETIKKYSF